MSDLYLNVAMSPSATWDGVNKKHRYYVLNFFVSLPSRTVATCRPRRLAAHRCVRWRGDEERYQGQAHISDRADPAAKAERRSNKVSSSVKIDSLSAAEISWQSLLLADPPRGRSGLGLFGSKAPALRPSTMPRNSIFFKGPLATLYLQCKEDLEDMIGAASPLRGFDTALIPLAMPPLAPEAAARANDPNQVFWRLPGYADERKFLATQPDCVWAVFRLKSKRKAASLVTAKIA
ncbi:hypothetical protein IWW34DRAFT_796868 [Fusarium oxysporum f. sp. albedinis]|nr:hypothetical protein IWW34DRAFT_796868 [Fusarium oxysporum f. sp. albedinis]